MGRIDEKVIDFMCKQSLRVVGFVVQMIRNGLLLLCNVVLHGCASAGKARSRASVIHLMRCCLSALFLAATVIVALP